ncbi:transcription-repair coupling factor [Candidatus Desantisbacteria bacterium CG_4_10_14_0_8_um_filter_48_22]|uniref:Transcription-repair-coupling factor n=1 Tax=Candidatus Desantisbacteria bacterium CG_4_10_14_0_8_um_filter_48_22 TaxID=1974543 RepID=A0A2M7SDG7_9BACT|nr:MAG: transcription-repair coupling factor [Candidatus Desantisbacteria bacterium CG1_02_49_89]PIV54297.1 MAG: transcription-repair coupling factor [Candidatus Desantisbacteria bacterium CG02_land_8_20_14_3_00_49_13]PIZ17558.1 MAG: transcription-repair coupling factor [Candidatus Desantisbacteria bacterium CG_4_10_14_0_8_um_filter_48_22]
MNNIISLLKDRAQFKALSKIMGSGSAVRISGMWGSSGSCLAAALKEKTGRSLVIVVPEEEIEEVSLDLAALGFDDILLFPQKEVLENENLPEYSEITSRRISTLAALSEKTFSAKNSFTIVTSPKAIQEKLPRVGTFAGTVRKFSLGEKISREDLIKYLSGSGYVRSPQVMFSGDFSVRGGIIDVCAASREKPVRIEMLGDEIVSLREFDIETQTSVRKISEIIIPPAAETQPGDEWQILLDYIPQDSTVMIHEPFSADSGGVSQALKNHRAVYLNRSASDEPGVINFNMQPVPLVYQPDSGYKENRISSLISEIKNFHKINCSVLLLAEYRGQAERMVELLKEYDIIAGLSPHLNPLPHTTPPSQSSPIEGGRRIRNNEVNGARKNKEETIINVLDISHGWVDPGCGIAVIVLKEIFGVSRVRKHKNISRKDFLAKGWSDSEPADSFLRGDYIVHINYGIGLFGGMKTIPVEGSMQDLFMVEYAEGNKLYVPLEQMNLLQRYIGRLDPPPPLNHLGSTRWQNIRKRTKESVREYAKELLELYAWRKSLQGYSFSKDSHWQQEFEMDFPYEETADQLRTIQEVKDDMEKDVPMDRVVCGDVGYGKTEVAMRAAFKSVTDGKQAAILVPTTILAEQHFQTFSERMAPYPVRIGMLSRFNSGEEQEKILKEISEGKIDIVIGTHRLIQSDVKFPNLGLLVVDEEQRFGVAQKEYLKKVKKNVDVLSLSATPIPRTLYMSVHGVRDMSIIGTPPPERLSIKTFVTEFSPQAVRTAILREMERKGQVFYVHNRIRTIDVHLRNLQNLVPDARIAVAHGQMDEEKLEQIMLKFLSREYDVLLSTDIVGAGLDIANANTIIVTDCQDFGLAQLYQLRGRVGRTGHQAYAYIFYNPAKVATESARRRLKAVSEFVQLGSGLRLAMRDLEIRGAGNLLGKEQHGHIQRVGLELYCKMLEDAVSELKGEPAEEEIEPVLNLKIDAFLPDEYIGSSEQKTVLYKRMVCARNLEEINDFRNEMKDRYGEPPKQVLRLMELLEIRILARNAGVKSVELKENYILFTTDAENFKFEIPRNSNTLDQAKKHLLALPRTVKNRSDAKKNQS